MIKLITTIIGLILLFLGIIIFLFEIIGFSKFKYILNRMHAAGMGDTLGIFMVLFGLIFINGINFTSAKLLLIVVFLWFASPTASHLISRLEVATNEDIKEHVSLEIDREDLE